MRNSITLFINGNRHDLASDEALMTVAEYLRYRKGLTGTKVVCAEGDCGACTILVSRMEGDELGAYKAINSCISFMYLLDRCSLITVEGLRKDDVLHPVQTAMVACHGAQCGYCTPGFICAMASLTEDAKKEGFALTEKKTKNYLTGNLCRCTGYDSIIKAGCSVDLNTVSPLASYYDDTKMAAELVNVSGAVRLASGTREVYLPSTLDEAVKGKATSRVTSGATDLGVLSNKRKVKLEKVMALTNVASLSTISGDDKFLTIGARATLDQVEKATKNEFPEFSKLLRIFASPQIKNSGTLAGNVVNASPIADTIPFLRVAEAEFVLKGSSGDRTVNANAFFKGGYKELDLKSDEILTAIKLPKEKFDYKLYKVSTRKDLDISSVTLAVRYRLQEDVLTHFSLAVGGVGASVLRMSAVERKAQGHVFDQKLFKALAVDLKNSLKPLSDVRGTSDYRLVLAHNLLLKFCDEVMKEKNLGLTEISL